MSQMVITDLDGTLLDQSQIVSDTDYATLERLGELGVVRVIATGRSPHSFNKVIPQEFPIDYFIFSSGSGIMNWKTKEILQNFSISSEKVSELVEVFKSEDLSFKVLAPAPNNHKYLYYSNGDHHSDFEKRMEFYRGHEKKIEFDPPNYAEASQILIILPPKVEEFNRLSALCVGVKVIRATSPLDHKSIWMEVFHPAVSKGNAVEHLCRLLGVSLTSSIAIGNDYNDIDMLEIAGESFVVENAPIELKEKYIVVSSNQLNGFTEAVFKSGIPI